MHRQIVYPQAVPLETDLLNTNKNTMIALGWLAQGILGTNTLVTDVTCIANTPAALNVVVTKGQIFSLQNVDGSSYSSLGTDTSHNVLKQGLLVDNAVLTITPPATVGFSQNYLIQAAFSETDGGSTTLPYYNPANPAVAWSGPSGSGTPQFTVRQNLLTVGAKAGVAASSGTQATPAPDAGYVGLFVVTVANGATTISSGNISQLATAPMLALNGQLPLIPTGVQNNTWTYAADTGAANSLTVTLAPPPPAYVAGLGIHTKVLASTTGAATINVNGLGAKSIVRRGGNALQAGDLQAGAVVSLLYDGTNFQLIAPQPGSATGRGIQVYMGANGLSGGGGLTGNWTVPNGVTEIDVEVWGGGGGGSGGNSTVYGSGAGGSAYGRGIFSVVPGTVYAYTVGGGGAGGTSGGGAGAAGSTSSLGALISAAGGPGASALSSPGVGGATTSGADVTIVGGGGNGSLGTGGTIPPGGDAGGGGGKGGQGGQQATAPGGGAAGGTTNAAGGSGAAGGIIIRWRA